MKVWICVIGFHYEGYQIVEAFDTHKKALDWQDETDSLQELGEVVGDYTDIYEQEVK